MKISYLCLIAIATLFCCGEEHTSEGEPFAGAYRDTLVIASHHYRLKSSPESGRFLLQRSSSEDKWTLLWEWPWGIKIQNFEFEEGYECVLSVNIYPYRSDMEDDIIQIYDVIEVLSKEQKDSNVPDIFVRDEAP